MFIHGCPCCAGCRYYISSIIVDPMSSAPAVKPSCATSRPIVGQDAWICGILSKYNRDIAKCRRYSTAPAPISVLLVPLFLLPNVLFSSWTGHAMKEVNPVYPLAIALSCKSLIFSKCNILCWSVSPKPMTLVADVVRPMD